MKSQKSSPLENKMAKNVPCVAFPLNPNELRMARTQWSFAILSAVGLSEFCSKKKKKTENQLTIFTSEIASKLAKMISIPIYNGKPGNI